MANVRHPIKHGTQGGPLSPPTPRRTTLRPLQRRAEAAQLIREINRRDMAPGGRWAA